MTDVARTTMQDIEAFALRHGLTNLAPDQMQRLAEIADVVSAVGSALPRMESKDDEPAYSFCVPQL